MTSKDKLYQLMLTCREIDISDCKDKFGAIQFFIDNIMGVINEADLKKLFSELSTKFQITKFTGGNFLC